MTTTDLDDATVRAFAATDRRRNMACRCVGVEMGSYDAHVPMWTPWRFNSDGKHHCVGIDACIAHEIASLWALGIKTANSCCGHGKVGGSILVYDESIPAMLELGYKQADPGRPEWFHSACSKEIQP